MKLDPRSPVPLYHQLRQILRRRLVRSGSRLPSEHELCDAFGVTRPTVRQALDGLVREGRVVKRRGVGAFAAAPPVPVGLFALSGTTAAFAARRLRLRTRLLSSGLVTGCPIGPRGGAPREWVLLQRLRRIGARPVFFERTWVLAVAAPGLERVNLSDRSLYDVLAKRFGLRVEGGMQRFEAVAAKRPVARLLRRRAGAPLLRVERVLDLSRHPGGFRVELFAGEGPFVLEERVPGPAAVEEFAPSR